MLRAVMAPKPPPVSPPTSRRAGRPHHPHRDWHRRAGHAPATGIARYLRDGTATDGLIAAVDATM